MGERKRRRETPDDLTTLKGLIEHADKFAVDWFNEHGEIAPQWIAVAGDDEVMAILTPWRDEEEKVSILSALRVKFADAHVKRYALMSEAWCVRLDIEEGQRIAREGQFLTPPREDPRRIEIVSIIAADRSGASLGITRDIIRGAGKPKLGPPQRTENQGATHYSGRMSELLF